MNVVVNTLIRIAVVGINAPLIAVSFGGLSSEASHIVATKSVIIAITPLVDILTALSLLYLYHMLGLKKRRQNKEEGCDSFAGLARTTVNEEQEDQRKEYINKLTYKFSSEVLSEE